MRKDPFGVGSFVHVFNRGNRKQEIVRDDIDSTRFLQGLFYFNNEQSSQHIFRDLARWSKLDFYRGFEVPPGWGDRVPLVKIHAFILIYNHFHLILEEIKEGGIAKFMQKFGTGVTNRFNTRHDETGRLFQGSYKARTIDDDDYLRYLVVYIHIKNGLEMYPGGIKEAMKNFDDAYEFLLKYPYSSLPHYADINPSPIMDDDSMIRAAFPNPEELKDFARNCMEFVYFDESSNKIKTTGDIIL